MFLGSMLVNTGEALGQQTPPIAENSKLVQTTDQGEAQLLGANTSSILDATPKSEFGKKRGHKNGKRGKKHTNQQIRLLGWGVVIVIVVISAVCGGGSSGGGGMPGIG